MTSVARHRKVGIAESYARHEAEEAVLPEHAFDPRILYPKRDQPIN